MPRYDYQCEAGHRYEKTESFGSPAQQPCQRCGKPALRLLSAPSIVFKGSGWYSTDKGRSLRPGVGSVRDGESSDSDGESADGAGDSEAAPTAKKPAKAKGEKKPAKAKTASDE